MSRWLNFLRHYGPVSRNDNMYDETIQRASRRQKITPIEFEHPIQSHLISCFDKVGQNPVSVILTGTAGDGKTHLCRKVWELLGGKIDDWTSNSAYLKLETADTKFDKSDLSRSVTIHFIRDLSGWAPQQGALWDTDKERLMHKFCQSLFNSISSDLFLIAANDGQLTESLRRLPNTADVLRTRNIVEELLVEDRQEAAGIQLKFFNLSRTNSAELFDRVLEGFMSHPGWSELQKKDATSNELFGPQCPIRHNYELLNSPLIRSRLRSLLELCDFNGLHVPIRQILLLLTNAVLGHPDSKDQLMVPGDIPKIIASDTVSKASLYNNIFGGNLSEIRRQSISIFEYLDRFQIGYETSNRIDNLLIFGEGDEHLGHHFEAFIKNDRFYGADSRFYAAKQEYIEGASEDRESAEDFLKQLIGQRRGLFFKIPKEYEEELNFWDLTVFRFAGEYLEAVTDPLKNGQVVKGPILWRLVKGLNRVFTGMLINSNKELILATSGTYSQAKVSRLLVDKISVEPSKGEKVSLSFDVQSDAPFLSVYLTPHLFVPFKLTLIRFEFLSRIAIEGALPASFSKECYEDLLAFKSKLIAAQMQRQAMEPETHDQTLRLKLLSLTDEGMPDPRFIEIV